MNSLFYIFAGLIILSGVYMVLTRNLLYAALSLLLILLSLAAIYVLLFADFVAITQLMVYVGGVLVLVLFGIMLSSRVKDESMRSESVNIVWGPLVAALVFTGLSTLIRAANFSGLPWLQQQADASPLLTGGTTVYLVGVQLMTTYVLPFELASLILLIALMGAAYISANLKRR
ncbi:NADH-quinone oxidoreductase subunit J [soil metagenome]